MRYLPKILRDLFTPVPLPPASDGAAPPDRIARLIRVCADRMIAAEVAVVDDHRTRVEAMFADFGVKLEDHHGR